MNSRKSIEKSQDEEQDVELWDARDQTADSVHQEGENQDDFSSFGVSEATPEVGSYYHAFWGKNEYILLFKTMFMKEFDWMFWIKIFQILKLAL